MDSWFEVMKGCIGIIWPGSLSTLSRAVDSNGWNMSGPYALGIYIPNLSFGSSWALLLNGTYMSQSNRPCTLRYGTTGSTFDPPTVSLEVFETLTY